MEENGGNAATAEVAGEAEAEVVEVNVVAATLTAAEAVVGEEEGDPLSIPTAMTTTAITMRW